jgi:hypothetical protein
MKASHKLLLGLLIVLGAQLAGSGCVGYVGGGGGGGDVWVHDDVWVDGGGRGWYGHGGAGYVHPGGGWRR